jgi:hypothetical protein
MSPSVWVSRVDILKLEERYAAGQVDRLPALASELVALPVDMIAANGEAPISAAKRASDDLPIIMLIVADPIVFSRAKIERDTNGSGSSVQCRVIAEQAMAEGKARGAFLKTASSPPLDLSPNHDEVFAGGDVGTTAGVSRASAKDRRELRQDRELASKRDLIF